MLHAQGALREDLVNTYLAFLEHEDPYTRRGACRALAVLQVLYQLNFLFGFGLGREIIALFQARRCISALVFVNSTDHSAMVREEAKRAVLSFGAEGKEALKASSYDITRV